MLQNKLWYKGTHEVFIIGGILNLKRLKILVITLFIWGSSLPLYSHDHDKKLPQVPQSEVSSQFINALASAYATNATLQAKVAEQKALAENVPKAKSGWLPSINAQTSVTRSRTDTQSPAPDGRSFSTTTSGALTASQNIFRGGGTVAAVSVAENQVRAGWADYSNTEQEILLSASQSYLEHYSSKKVYDLNLKNETVFRELLKSIFTRAKLGELPQTDVANAESELADAITKRIASRADLETKKGTYLRVIGFEAPESQDLPKLPMDLIPKDFSSLLKEAMIYNPRILNSSYTAKANHDTIGVAQSTLLPQVNVEGSASRSVSKGTRVSESRNVNGRQNAYSAKATLSIPLFQGGASWADLRKARQTATQTKISLEATRRAIKEACRQSWESWVSVRLRIEQIKTQIKSARINLAGVMSEFKEGERIFIEVLDAENKLFNAKVSLETAKKDLYVAAYTLLSLVGKLTADHLKLPVEKYDVERHYNLVRNKWFGTISG